MYAAETTLPASRSHSETDCSVRRCVSILLIVAVVLCTFSCTAGTTGASEDRSSERGRSRSCCAKCCERQNDSPAGEHPKDGPHPDTCVCQGICGGAILRESAVWVATPLVDSLLPHSADRGLRICRDRSSDSPFGTDLSGNFGHQLRLRVCSLTC